MKRHIIIPRVFPVSDGAEVISHAKTDRSITICPENGRGSQSTQPLQLSAVERGELQE
jgi:hypothetical protein